MTPAINLLLKQKVPHLVHRYEHDPASESYGLEAAEKMAVAAERVFKTLVVSVDDKQLAVGIIPVAAMLSMKHMAKAVGAKKAVMAAVSDAERATGYVAGGISPLGQKKSLQTVIDRSAEQHTSIFISAGRRGLEIEISPEELRRLVRGIYAELSQ